MDIFSYFQRKGIDTVDKSFYRMIALWESWYKGRVRNFTFYKIYSGQGTSIRRQRKSLGMAKKLSEDIADLLLNERVQITLSDESTGDFVENVLKENRFYVLGNDYQERKAYSGTVAYIPYIKDAEVTEDGSFQSGKIGIDYVSASNIFPISWSNGRVTECAFTFPKTVARKKYVQVQFHRMEQTVNGSQYVIENTVLECQSGSREGTELAEEEWKKLSPFRFLAKRIETGSPEPQFVIDRLNIVNNADTDESNPMGVAIYANAIDVLKSLDIKYDSYSNEFELGRKRIFVAPEMMKNVNGSIAFDPEDVTFYMMPDEYDKSQEGLIKEVNMDLRSEQHSGAINDDLNYLSLKCGFGTERYKFDCSGVKTATEVISEKAQQPDVDTITRERDAAQKELQELKNEKILTGKGVKADDLDYVMFKVSKLVDDKTDFTKAAEKFLKENPKYTGAGTYRVSTSTGSDNQDTGGSVNMNINDRIRAAARR